MNHPIRYCKIIPYSNRKHGWVAQFDDGVKYPVLFRGKTKAEVIEVAEIYRKRTIAMAKREKAAG